MVLMLQLSLAWDISVQKSLQKQDLGAICARILCRQDQGRKSMLLYWISNPNNPIRWVSIQFYYLPRFAFDRNH